MTDSKKITINQNGFWGGEFPFADGKIIDRKPMLAVEDEHSEMVLDEVEKAIAEGRQSVYIDWETWDWVIEGVVPVGHQAWILDDEGRYVHKFSASLDGCLAYIRRVTPKRKWVIIDARDGAFVCSGEVPSKWKNTEVPA